MKETRQQTRRIAREVFFIEVTKDYGGEPRKNRRLLARRGGNRAWRYERGLDEPTRDRIERRKFRGLRQAIESAISPLTRYAREHYVDPQ